MAGYRGRGRTPSEYDEKVIQVNRVSKKTKGGNQIGFSVLVVVGDRKGKVAVALGKAPDVLSSIKKGVRKAKKRFIQVPTVNHTIPFAIEEKHGAAVVLLKPAPPGTGIKAGGAVRDVVETAGIRNVVGKILGSNNQTNNAYATFNAFKTINKIVDLKQIDLKDTVKKAEPKVIPQKPNQKTIKNIPKPSKATKKVTAKPTNSPRLTKKSK